MTTLRELLAPYVSTIEAEMKQMVPSLDHHRSFLGQIYYHLGWVDADYNFLESPGGKRVRAAFCLMAAEACGGSQEEALPAAVAIELLHEFSLIHDDIEDGDRARRHRPTLWTIVGPPQAINAGDGLFALAQRALLESTTRGIPAERVLQAQRRFNETALDLCIGQHLDMDFERREVVSPDEYLRMIHGKTAALLAFAGEVGAMMGGADEQRARHLHEMGEAMGLAFQMWDDFLGLWGDPERTGKPVGADIRARKKSLPVAYALSQPGSERLRELYRGSLDDEATVQQIRELIEATGAQAYVVKLAQEQEARALSLLGRIAAPAERVAPLRHLVELLSNREH